MPRRIYNIHQGGGVLETRLAKLGWESRSVQDSHDFEPTSRDIAVFYGGADIPTQFYGQGQVGTTAGARGVTIRDKLEYRAFVRCIERGTPVFGICRGAQLACVMAGGSLIQDVSNHGVWHPLITDNTDPDNPIQCNSGHHQMMRPHNTAHIVLGWTPHRSNKYVVDLTKTREVTVNIDFPKGEPEIVFFPAIKALAVQFHPEYNTNTQAAQIALNLMEQYLLNGDLNA